MLEHDYEPEAGLPQSLPSGERRLWRGGPEFASLVRSTFHVRKLALYFVALLVLRVVFRLRDGATLADVIPGTAGLALLAAAALALLAFYARLLARTTLYTITNRRVVIRCGVAVPVTINLPLQRIDAADLRQHADGSGDIALLPEGSSRVSYVLLWPFVKPWRWLRVRPVMRGLPDAQSVAGILGEALAAGAAAAREEELHKAAAGDVDTPQPLPAAAREGRADPRRWLRYPTAPLAAAVSLVVVALVAVAWLRVTGVDPARSEPAAIVVAVNLFFEDRVDGSVAVIDAADGAEVDVLEPGTNGFLRSTLRSMVRARKAVDAGDELPFSLWRTETMRLVLYDQATGREIDLLAFGKTNAEVFGRILSMSAARRAAVGGNEPSGAIVGETTVALTKQEARE